MKLILLFTIALMVTLPVDTGRLKLYEQKVEYFKNINPDSSAFYANKGLLLAKKLNSDHGQAVFTAALAELDMRQGRMDSAKTRFLRAREQFRRSKDEHGIARADNGLGIVAAKQGNYNEALPYFLDAMHIYEHDKDTRGMISSYIKLGALNEQTNNLEKALDYYTKGLALDKSFPPSTNTGTLLNDIGIIYFKRNDFKTGITYMLRGLANTTNPQLADVRILLLVNAGGGYHNLGEDKLAYRYDLEALQLIRARKIPEQEINTLVNMATLVAKRKPDSSALMLKQAMAISKSINQRYLALDVYQGMVELNKQTGNYKKAEAALEARDMLKDSLFTLQKSKQLATLQAQYDLTKKNVEVQQLELANQRVGFRQRIAISVAVGIAALLSVVMFFYSRSRNTNRLLVKQKKQLDDLNQFKDRLFSIIGHDLRAPVSMIISMLNFFNDQTVSVDEVKQMVPELQRQATDTLDILDKLLVWGKSHLVAGENHKSVFNGTSLVRQNISLYTQAAIQKSITVYSELPEDLSIYADPTQVDFIIRNLLANAIKYTHLGGIVTIMVRHDKSYHTLLVRDNGVGISPELQQRIFEPGNESTEGTANEKGTSIGLMLCKAFTEENNGTIKVESAPGSGTCFEISLPAGIPE